MKRANDTQQLFYDSQPPACLPAWSDETERNVCMSDCLPTYPHPPSTSTTTAARQLASLLSSIRHAYTQPYIHTHVLCVTLLFCVQLLLLLLLLLFLYPHQPQHNRGRVGIALLVCCCCCHRLLLFAIISCRQSVVCVQPECWQSVFSTGLRSSYFASPFLLLLCA